MKDVYFSALRLQTALEDILASRGYGDIDAHHRGECRCKRPARVGGSDSGADGAYYLSRFLKLSDDIEDFRFAFAEATPRLTGEFGFAVYRVAATVEGLRCVVVQGEADLAMPSEKCAGESLMRIEERCELLQTRVAELNMVLGAPDAMTSKWLPVHSWQECGREAGDVAPNGREETNSSAADAALSVEGLREIVRRHCACYEVLPEWSAGGGRRTHVGYSLRLCGVNEANGSSHTPGCSHCHRTYDGLRKVAEWVMPEEELECHIEIETFDRAWHVAPAQRRSRREVVATVKILHRHDVHAPVSDCQRSCLKEMRAKLAELGVRDGVWQPAEAATS